jgi:DNA helicase IV
MDQEQKDKILKEARGHVREIREEIQDSIDTTSANILQGKEDFKTLSASDQVTQMVLLQYGEKRLEELEQLYPSPYFVRCDVLLDGEQEPRSMRFAKFPFSEHEIYSWTAPVATIRFEPMGRVRYVLPDGTEQAGQLLRRDQYMIVDGKVVFLSTESVDLARELVYQEHFSSRKQGFVLPEIVAQMEKAQDQVIRAHHVGPFVISGPAGSGKTTLALHRVAYLVQSPDTAPLYPSQQILVLVQDTGTKQYFSQLLPELGIHDVAISTFSEWAFEVLGLSGMKYVGHYGRTTGERDGYEYAKLNALRSASIAKGRKGLWDILENTYAAHFDADQMWMLNLQKKEKVLDRVDLTVLLMVEKAKRGSLGSVREYYLEQKNGKLKKKVGHVPLEYSLLVIDEFQNYLPEQLQLLRSCLKSSPGSVVYVGDMAQQIRLGTVRGWEEIGERISEDRKVKLQKVYRNTKNILRYIQELGYPVEILEGMREGVPVEEIVLGDAQAEIRYVEDLLRGAGGRSVGVLAKNEEYLLSFREVFKDREDVRVFTIEESQGVEFDIVCLVGVNRKDWEVSGSGLSEEFANEKRKILGDLLYIALTRAISELHVLGRHKLREISLCHRIYFLS